MPRGGKRGHKGQRRHFTSPEQLEVDKQKEAKQREWRRGREDGDEDDESNEDQSEGSSEESDSDEDDTQKAKGVSHLIEVANPNRIASKSKKVSQLQNDTEEEAKPELSRREREELQRQQAKAKYDALHAAGKTDQAKADLARLAIIRQQRDEAARKKEEERKAKANVTKKS